MSVLKRSASTWTIALLAIAAIAFTGALTAQSPAGLSAFDGGPVGELTGDLPEVVRGPMNVVPGPTPATSILSFDDGTCESGLGVGAPHTALVDFDVPTQCIQAGLDIVGLTVRVNTFTATAFGYGQAGATPPTFGSLSTVGVPPIFGLGPCPGTAVTTRAIGPGAAVITGTSNFFAGVRYGSAGGFIGRDTNGPAAMRQWLNCPTCGMTQYSPADITGIGFPGNFIIRVTVEDQNCIPVELMDFKVSDG